MVITINAEEYLIQLNPPVLKKPWTIGLYLNVIKAWYIQHTAHRMLHEENLNLELHLQCAIVPTGDWAQDFVYGRQALYQVIHTPILFTWSFQIIYSGQSLQGSSAFRTLKDTASYQRVQHFYIHFKNFLLPHRTEHGHWVHIQWLPKPKVTPLSDCLLMSFNFSSVLRVYKTYASDCFCSSVYHF